MYSMSWARERVNQHMGSHTRATEFLLSRHPSLKGRLPLFLATGSPEWEAWKYLVRMIENGWGIRAKPNTTERLSSEKALSVLVVILEKSFNTNPKYLLTGLETYRTLYEQLRVREPHTLDEVLKSIVPDDGQLALF